MFGFVTNTRLAEGHLKPSKFGGWGGRISNFHSFRKDLWVMGYLLGSWYFTKRDWKESFQKCYSFAAESCWSLIAIREDLIARAVWEWVIRIEAGLCWEVNELVNKHIKMWGRMKFSCRQLSLLEWTFPYNSDFSCLLQGCLQTMKAMWKAVRSQDQLGGVVPKVETTFSRQLSLYECAKPVFIQIFYFSL